MENKKVLFGLLAVILLVGGALAGVMLSNKEDKYPLIKEELVKYFGETISNNFVESIGQPIEGISPPMFLELFPNLRYQDLDRVQTALGYYRYENNQLVYKPVGPQTHSAAQMITEEGYETLLDNLATRFDVELKNKKSIDRIIEKLYGEIAGSQEITFRTISKETDSQITQRTQNVIKTQGVWVNFWTDHSVTDGPIPQINFDEKMIIVVTQGQKSTGGYSTEIVKIIERENEIAVYVKEKTPGYCAADTVITSPHHIVEIKKSNKPVKFVFEIEEQICGPVVTSD